ncbi:MAG: hypothetical protein OJJ54_16000 [Pseudonocardia sp.]|nr:hypothetical protein [Pseudonocardia sp.]
MHVRKLITLAAGALVLPLVGAGAAHAAETEPQSPLQGLSAGLATTDQLLDQFADAADGNGPSGADGVETEFPQLDPRLVEGPAGGLIKNGPFE